MAKYSVFDCTMVELDKHHSDRKGNLTVVQNGTTLPFDVKRVYYLYDVPGGESRGSHAHRDLEQLIIVLKQPETVDLLCVDTCLYGIHRQKKLSLERDIQHRAIL